MGLSSIYTKTANGLKVRKSLFGGLPSQQMRVLELVDGKNSVEDILLQLGIAEQKLIATITQLEKDGYIKYLSEQTKDDDWELGDYFAPMVVEEVEISEGMEIKEGYKIDQIEEIQEFNRLEDERKAREIEAQIRERERAKQEAEALEKAEKQAQEEAEKSRIEQALAKAKAEAEARERAEAEAKALAEAQEKSRLEAERVAQAEAEKEAEKERLRLEQEAAWQKAEHDAKLAEEARLALEQKNKLEIETQIRLEAERTAREAEEQQRQAQETLQKAEAEAQALVERIRAKEKARREQVRKAKEEEAARKKAEEEAKALEDARLAEIRQAELDAQKREQAEAEARAIEQAKEAARMEAERILREEELARQRAEEAARQEAERILREEELARLAAEEAARQEAERIALEEEKARLKAEREAQAMAAERARQQVAEQARLEAEEKARAKEEAKREKERIAQEKAAEKARIKAEEKARKEAEKLAKQEQKAAQAAEKEAKKRAEQTMREQALSAHTSSRESASGFEDDDRELISWEVMQAQMKRKASRKKWLRKPAFLSSSNTKRAIKKLVKVCAIYVPIAFIILLGLMHVVSLSMLNAPIEKLASAALGAPVKVGEVRASLWPEPHFKLNNVSAGENSAVNIATVQMSPEISSLFSDNKVVKSLVIEGADLSDKDFQNTDAWLHHLPKDEQLSIGNISFKQIKLNLNDLALGTFEGDIHFNDKQQLASVEMKGTDNPLRVEVMPREGRYDVRLTAEKWPLPVGTQMVFETLSARGEYRQNQLNLSQVSGEIYGGKFTANTVLSWSDAWRISGDFNMDKVNTKQVLAAFASKGSVEGKLNLNGQFSAQSQTAGNLMDAAIVTARFEIPNGKINGVDIPHAIVTPADKSLEGYNTGFDKLTGNLQISNNQYQYRNLVLKSEKMQAQGQVDIDEKSNISGKVNANLTTSTRNFQTFFDLTGKVDNVKRNL